jgi:hypothetical protein
VGEITGAFRSGQTFVAQDDYLSQIQVLGATYGGRAKGKLVFHLLPGTGTDSTVEDIVTTEVDVSTLPDNSYWPITFDPISDSEGKSFYFYFEAPATVSGEAATVWYSQQDVYVNGNRMENGVATEGDLAFRALSLARPDRQQWFTKVLDGGNTATSVFENSQALPGAWVVYGAEVIHTSDERLRRLRDLDFDYRKSVLLSEDLPRWATLNSAESPPCETVSIIQYEPERVTVRTECPQPGLLIVADLYYPGWIARLDDRETPIWAANHALRAVYVQAGSHTIEFTYEPASFNWGLLITGCGLVVVLLLATYPLIRRRQARRQLIRPAGAQSLSSPSDN